MTVSVNQGETADMLSQWYQYVSGPPVDVSALTIAVNKVADGSNVIPATSAGIIHQATGVYSFQWAVSTSQAAGDYIALWNGTFMGSAVNASEIVTVLPYDNSVFLTWCDITLNEDLINGQGNVLAVNPVTWVKTDHPAGPERPASAEYVQQLHPGEQRVQYEPAGPDVAALRAGLPGGLDAGPAGAANPYRGQAT
jgi:hypothetical protein